MRQRDLPSPLMMIFDPKPFPPQRRDIREPLDTRPNLMDTVNQM
jgi:hypothetical protein